MYLQIVKQNIEDILLVSGRIVLLVAYLSI